MFGFGLNMSLGSMVAGAYDGPMIADSATVLDGGANGTSLAIPVSATAGNRLLLYVAIDKASGTINVPTDDGTNAWTLVGSKHEAGSGVSGALYTKIAAGDETSITASWTNSRRSALALVELSGAGAIDRTGISTAQASTAARTSGVITASGETTTSHQLALAFTGTDSLAATSSSTSHGWSNGFSEFLQVGMTGDSGNVAPSVSVGFKQIIAPATPSTEFTWTDDDVDEAMGVMVTVKAG